MSGWAGGGCNKVYVCCSAALALQPPLRTVSHPRLRPLPAAAVLRRQRPLPPPPPPRDIPLEERWNYLFNCLEAAAKLGRNTTYAAAGRA